MDNACVIEVTGFTEDTDLEILELFFENKRSGGGPIKSFDSTVPGIIKITYEEPEAAQRVLQRRKHVVSGRTLSVRPPRKEKPKSAVARRAAQHTRHAADSGSLQPKDAGTTDVPNTPRDERCFILKGIAEGTTKDHIDLFLENRTGIEEAPELIFGEPGTIMVRYSKEITDFERIAQSISQKKLKEANVIVEPVFHTNCIMITNLPTGISKDMLQLYFENNKRSGGGDIEEIDMDSRNRFALIEFVNYQVVDQVLRRTHVISSVTLELKPHYKDFSSSKYTDVQNTESELLSVCVSVEPFKMEFIMSRKEFKEDFEKQMELSCSSIEWPHMNDDTQVQIRQTSCLDKSRQRTDESEGWPGVAELTFSLFLSRFSQVEIVIPRDVFDTVERMVTAEDSKANVLFDKDTSAVRILGEITCVQDLEGNIRSIIEETAASERKKKEMETKTTETIKLDTFQIKQLLMLKFTQELSKKCPESEVALVPKDNAIVLKGTRDDILQMKIMMYEKLHNMCTSHLKSFTPEVIDFLKSRETANIVYDFFKADHIQAIYHIEDKEVRCCSPTKDDLGKAVRILETRVGEKRIDVEPDFPPVSFTGKWISLQNNLQEQSSVRITVHQGDLKATIIVAGFQSSLETAVEQIKLLIQQNTIQTTTLEAEACVVKYLFKLKTEALKKIEDQAKSPSFQMTQKLTGPVTGIDIKGPGSDIDVAVTDLKKLIASVKCRKYTVNKPGLPRLFKEPKGQSFLRKVENEFNCLIEEQWSEDGKEEASLVPSYYAREISALLVYTDLQQAIDSSILKIQNFTETEFVDKTIDTEDLRHLGVQDIADIKIFADPLQVLVTVEANGGLRLQGTQASVAKVETKVDEILALKIESIDHLETINAIDIHDSETLVEHLPLPESMPLKDDGEDMVQLLPAKSDACTGDETAKFRVLTDEGIAVEIYCANIIEEEVDVIVNSANNRMEHKRGVAGALAQAAGQGLQRESDQFRRGRESLLRHSEVLHTRAYNLPCKYVIHAVGSQWKEGKEVERQERLKKLVQKCLAYADSKLKARSIALPAINCGVFKTPKKVCAEATCDAIKAFSQKSTVSGHLREIHIVDIDRETCEVMKSVFQQEFP